MGGKDRLSWEFKLRGNDVQQGGSSQEALELGQYQWIRLKHMKMKREVAEGSMFGQGHCERGQGGW